MCFLWAGDTNHGEDIVVALEDLVSLQYGESRAL